MKAGVSHLSSQEKGRGFLRSLKTIPSSYQDKNEQCLADGSEECHIPYKGQPQATGNLTVWLRPLCAFPCPSGVVEVEVPEPGGTDGFWSFQRPVRPGVRTSMHLPSE